MRIEKLPTPTKNKNFSILFNLTALDTRKFSLADTFKSFRKIAGNTPHSKSNPGSMHMIKLANDAMRMLLSELNADV